MKKTNHKLTKIEIKGLWGKFDFAWDLKPDVNILSGINGSGKSTVLNCVAEAISNNETEVLIGNIKRIIITFNTNTWVVINFIEKKDLINHLDQMNNVDEMEGIKQQIKQQEQLLDRKINHFALKASFFSNGERYEGRDIITELHETTLITQISTFDTIILEAGKKPDPIVKTELDRSIFVLQKLYLDYQLKISKKKDIIVESEDNIKEKVAVLRYPQNRFIEIIDTLFEGTGKKVNRAENEIMFLCGEEEILPYQLSSGEKQLLVILLSVLVQDNKPSILFMDEPEISLHFDWQKKLIQYIRELNPNVQLILATHSPAMIMDGWMDKVSEMSDLLIPIVKN